MAWIAGWMNGWMDIQEALPPTGNRAGRTGIKIYVGTFLNI